MMEVAAAASSVEIAEIRRASGARLQQQGQQLYMCLCAAAFA